MSLLTVEKVSDVQWLVGVKELNFWYTDESEQKALDKLAVRIRHVLSGKEHIKPMQKEFAKKALSEVRALNGRKKI